jgi:thiol-disulfide isomerase/thioredoxin
MKSILIVASVLIVSLSAFSQAKTIPPFSFQRFDNGKSFTELDLTKGKKIMFLFFDAECSHCQESAAVYNKEQGKLNDVSIYMVTRNDKASATTFLKKYAPVLSGKKNVTVLFDANNVFISRFLPKKFPSMFLYGKDQKLIIYSDEEKDIPMIISKATS